MDKELENFYKNNRQILENTTTNPSTTTAKAVDNIGKVCYLRNEMPEPLDSSGGESTPEMHEKRVSKSEAKRWLNSRELADYIGTTPEAVRKMVIREQVPAYRPFGTTLLFDRHEIDRKIQAHPVKAWYEKG